MNSLEKAARELCVLRGIEPDSQAVTDCGQPGCGVAHFGPAWLNAQEELVDLMNKLTALGIIKSLDTALDGIKTLAHATGVLPRAH